MAEVQSDVVGYQNRSLTTAGTTWCTGTFQILGKAQDAIKLGDLAVDNVDRDNYSDGDLSLSFYTPKNANLKFEKGDPADGCSQKFSGKSVSFKYVPQWVIDRDKQLEDYDGWWDGIDAGWYWNNDEEYSENFNEYPVPFGCSYGMKESALGYYLVYAGGVVKDDDMPTINLSTAGTVWTGNATPANLTLADFSIDNVDRDNYSDGDLSLSFYTPKNANLKFEKGNPADGCSQKFSGKSVSFKYVPQWVIDRDKQLEDYDGWWDGIDAGWYWNNDEEYAENFNAYPVPAGMGFGVKASATGYFINLPSAIK